MSTVELNKNVIQITAEDRALIKAVERGLPVASRPYAEIAKQLGTTEQDVISRLQHLMDNGAIKRYGVVVRHKELGYTANGMVVWDVPDDRVEELGMCIGKYSCVTLSYRRPRRLPDWSYNLFTMVHGSDREEVTRKVAEIVESCGLQNIEHTILFSTRRFKQRGASYTEKNYTPAAEQKTANNKSAKLRLVK
ncbi:MAG: AsnC family transcriptional regulator [Gammaproteobacteria bacterium]|nr:AsnC family transcriptional regulator [Gammaproteobacteria bacterium]